MVGFAGSIWDGTNLLSELEAIKFGLSLAWRRDHLHVICESDSLEVIELINSVDVKFHAYGCIINDIPILRNYD